jgi:hypothetical protein
MTPSKEERAIKKAKKDMTYAKIIVGELIKIGTNPRVIAKMLNASGIEQLQSCSEAQMYRRISDWQSQKIVPPTIKKNKTRIKNTNLQLRLYIAKIEISAYELGQLNLLCSYELETDELHCEMLPSTKKFTKALLEEYVRERQVHLKIPISEVILTQQLLDCDVSQSDIVESGMTAEKLWCVNYEYSGRTFCVPLTQFNNPISRINYDLRDATGKEIFLKLLNSANKNYTESNKNNLLKLQEQTGITRLSPVESYSIPQVLMNNVIDALSKNGAKQNVIDYLKTVPLTPDCETVSSDDCAKIENAINHKFGGKSAAIFREQFDLESILFAILHA